jgi:hypothetical protein
MEKSIESILKPPGTAPNLRSFRSKFERSFRNVRKVLHDLRYHIPLLAAQRISIHSLISPHRPAQFRLPPRNHAPPAELFMVHAVAPLAKLLETLWNRG